MDEARPRDREELQVKLQAAANWATMDLWREDPPLVEVREDDTGLVVLMDGEMVARAVTRGSEVWTLYWQLLTEPPIELPPLQWVDVAYEVVRRARERAENRNSRDGRYMVKE